jgi:hypothetical protein
MGAMLTKSASRLTNLFRFVEPLFILNVRILLTE